MPDVMNIHNALACQPGAIVSRTLVDKEGGTVTLFAFDRGQALSEHTAPFDALVQVTDGEAEVRIAGVAQRVAAGEMILMPAHRPHALKALTAFKMMLIMIRAAGGEGEGAGMENGHDRH